MSGIVAWVLGAMASFFQGVFVDWFLAIFWDPPGYFGRVAYTRGWWSGMYTLGAIEASLWFIMSVGSRLLSKKN